MQYRKKPVVIDAIQWLGDNLNALTRFTEGSRRRIEFDSDKLIRIETLEGVMTANVGDYIIKGVKGELYPCKPDIFEMTYEEVKDGNAPSLS